MKRQETLYLRVVLHFLSVQCQVSSLGGEVSGVVIGLSSHPLHPLSHFLFLLFTAYAKRNHSCPSEVHNTSIAISKCGSSFRKQ